MYAEFLARREDEFQSWRLEKQKKYWEKTCVARSEFRAGVRRVDERIRKTKKAELEVKTVKTRLRNKVWAEEARLQSKPRRRKSKASLDFLEELFEYEEDHDVLFMLEGQNKRTQIAAEMEEELLNFHGGMEEARNKLRAGSGTNGEPPEGAEDVRAQTQAKSNAEARLAMQTLIQSHEEHEARRTLTETENERTEVKENFYQETVSLLKKLCEDIEQREAEAEAKLERDRLERLRKQRPRQEEAELDAEREKQHQKERSQVLRERNDRVLYGSAYTWFARGCEQLSQLTKSVPPLGNFDRKKGNCTGGDKLGVCHHDIEKPFRGSGFYSQEFLQSQQRCGTQTSLLEEERPKPRLRRCFN
ncbi:hypothetical protein V8E51_001377 [Hyaloscypha variabilis]